MIPLTHFSSSVRETTCIHFLSHSFKTLVKMLLSSVVALIFSSAVTSGKLSNFIQAPSLSS